MGKPILKKRKEIWKSVKGYEGSYEISSWGRVKSLKRPWRHEDKIMKISQDGWGYYFVRLSKNCKPKNRKIHSLVALHFIGERTADTINHIDGDKSNNTPGNLEYCSQSENIKHAFKLGLSSNQHSTGENNYGASLTNEQVKEIKEILKNKKKRMPPLLKDLARSYGTTKRVIQGIYSGARWSHI